MRRLLIAILIFTICEAKSQTEKALLEYPNYDKSNSDNFSYYLPTELFKTNIYGKLEVDSSLVEFLSTSLKRMNESTFLNKYLGGESYRLIWLRSFHPPIIITIRHNGNKTEVLSKIGNKARFDNSYTDVSELSREEHEFYVDYKQGKETDSIKFKAISSKVIYHKDKIKFKTKEKKKTISSKKWDELKNEMTKNDILNQKTIEPSALLTDGAYWILEVNLKDGYKVIYRHSPDQNRFPKFRQVCDKIIDLSDFKKEERY